MRDERVKGLCGGGAGPAYGSKRLAPIVRSESRNDESASAPFPPCLTRPACEPRSLRARFNHPRVDLVLHAGRNPPGTGDDDAAPGSLGGETSRPRADWQPRASIRASSRSVFASRSRRVATTTAGHHDSFREVTFSEVDCGWLQRTRKPGDRNARNPLQRTRGTVRGPGEAERRSFSLDRFADVLAGYVAALASAPLSEQSRLDYASKVRQYLVWLAGAEVDGIRSGPPLGGIGRCATTAAICSPC